MLRCLTTAGWGVMGASMSGASVRAVVLGLAVMMAQSATVRADEDAANTRELFQKGNDAFNAKDYQRAAIFFQAAYERGRRPELLFNLALALQMSGQTSRAIAEYRRYLEVAPNGRGAEEAREFLAKNGVDIPPPAPSAPRRAAPLEDDDREAPARPAPEPPRGAYSPYGAAYPTAPVYYPRVYSRRVFKERLSVCPLGDGEWSFCRMHDGKTIGETTFIERYQKITNNGSLDEYMDTSWKKTPLTIAGGIFAGFTVMMIGGWVGVTGARSANGVWDSAKGNAAIAFGSIGAIGAFWTLVLGFPLAAREPRARHRMSPETARTAVREYNAALQREMGGY